MADYILTIVEQVGLMLAELARLKSGEKPAGISVLCLRETGLPLAVVKHSSPETILQLLKTGGGTQYARAVLLAEFPGRAPSFLPYHAAQRLKRAYGCNYHRPNRRQALDRGLPRGA